MRAVKCSQAFEFVRHLGIFLCQQRNRNHTACIQIQPVILKPDSTVPSESKVSTYSPFTMVSIFPIGIPFLAVTGRLSRTIATSVVVPPISTITAFSSRAIALPPTTLAAGPESSVSTGHSFVSTSDARLPSLRTIAIGILKIPFFHDVFYSRQKFSNQRDQASIQQYALHRASAHPLHRTYHAPL